MRTVAAILLFILISLPQLFSQGEIDEQEKIFYRNERTYAAILSTTGISGNFRYAKRVDAFKKTLYEIDFAQIKHEKEIKISYSSSQQLGGSFVYGKLNSLFTLRGGIGLQKELYRKEDKGGISIRYFYTFGPSIGLQKPVYYEVLIDGAYKKIRFESHIVIERKAPFYYGLKETTLVPGAYGKFGLTFEFGKSDVVFNAIETGIVVDAFIKTVPIMANNQNHWIFPSFFLSYRFGKIINAQFKSNSNKVDQILSE
jgi:hypothetical protein